MLKMSMASPAKLSIVSFQKDQVEALQSEVDARVQEPHEWLAPLVVEGAFPDEALRRRAGDADLLVVAGNLEGLPYADHLAKAATPMVLTDPPLVFHPFQAPLRHQLQRRGAVVLPADRPASIAASIRAVAARRQLRLSRVLLCTAPARNEGEPDSHKRMDAAAFERLGVAVIRRPVSELQQHAARVPDELARETLNHWRRTLIGNVDPHLPEAHLLDVARLYQAEKALLAETRANALGVEEFAPFLNEHKAMPNVTYALLKDEGITCTEEADLPCLLTEMLLAAVQRQQVTMSNIYTAYRDEFERQPEGPYTPAQQRADYEQCRHDQCAVVAHFSTAGSLPRNMMTDERYDIVETLPAWPGQSMVAARPRTQPVLLARLWEECERIDLFGPCDVVDVRQDPRWGWYRGRWLVRLPAFDTFAAQSIHTHYAIAPHAQPEALETLLRYLLKISVGCSRQDTK